MTDRGSASLGWQLRFKPGRNELCPCGSGQKYKACCGRIQPAAVRNLHDGQPHPDDASTVELAPLVTLLHAASFAQLELQTRVLLGKLPRSGTAWQLLGIALSNQGKDAVQAWMEAVKYLPTDAGAQLNLGNAWGRRGNLEEAAAAYRRALSIQPDFAEAHNNLGDVQLELGRIEDAAGSFRRAIQIRPELAEAHQNLGKALLRLGDYAQARESCQRAVRLAPESADAHNSLGNACSRLGRFEDALTSFRRALTLRPEFAEAHANLANTLRSTGRLQEAVNGYRLALRIKPDFVLAYTELATALRLQRLTVESEAACREALRIVPESAAVCAVLAELRADTGRFAEAEEYFKRAVSLDSESVEAWAGLARVRRMTTADQSWLDATQGLIQRGLPPQREMTLRYAIGKYFDDVRDFPAAFANYQRANELARRSAPIHDQAEVRRLVGLIIGAHDAAWLGRRRRTLSRSRRPVFIVGMLRSGTSLAEQILASHPAVYGAGELSYWSTELAARLAAGSTPNAHQLQVDDARLTELRRGYLELLLQVSPAATRVIDKLPTNFLALGLISAALPEARIIHMRRNPIDTCLSIYCQPFEAINTYTHDLGDLADYFRAYQHLMQHWRTVLPEDAMLDVPYEDLVADTEGWTRRMLEFIGLPWDPRCLQFQLTARTIVTASKWQVRQGIDVSSVARWRNYASFLGPLMSLADGTT